MSRHVKWPQDTRCKFHNAVHPGDFYAYEGVLPDGSGYFGPVCGEVAQGRYAEFEHLGFFDMGQSHPWTDSFGKDPGAIKEAWK